MPIAHIKLTHIETDTSTGVAVASITAVSGEMIEGQPVAEVTMKVRVKMLEGEPKGQLKARAYDEALMFLELFD